MNGSARATPARVAIVCPHLAGGQAGGVERVARWLHDALAAEPGYAPTLVSLAVSRRDADSVRLLGPTTWGSGPRTSSSRLGDEEVVHVGAWAVEVEAMRHRPRRALDGVLAGADLVQVVSGTPAFGYAASRTRAPVCLQVATTVAAERAHEVARSHPLRGLGVARLEQRALAAADHVFVENAWMQRTVARLAPTPATLAPPGVDDAWFTPASDHRQGAHLLSVCRLGSARKNLDGLLRTYATARARPGGGRLLPLVLAGAGPVPRALRALADRLDVEVRWEPDPDEAALRALYRDARALVLASHEEGLGMVLPEALACGTPVVATATAGATEVVGRAGDAVELVACFRGSSGPLAGVLLERSMRPLAPADRAAARRAAVAGFGRVASLRRFTDVYERLL